MQNDLKEKGRGRGRRPIADARRVTKRTRLNAEESERFETMKSYYDISDSELIRASLRNMWQKYLVDIKKKAIR